MAHRESPGPLSVIWLFGPPGVGKTTTGWALYRRFCAEGSRTAYVDIDQLGMRHPSPASDPENHRVKARNLAAVLRTFAAAGAQRVVISGIAAPGDMEDFAAHAGDAKVIWCRLAAAEDELRDRLVRHRAQPEMVDDALEHAALLDAHDLADVRIDTTGRNAADVVERAARAFAARSDGGRPAVVPRWKDGSAPAGTTTEPPNAIPARAILVSGARAVGKSTVAWRVFERVQREGRTAAFIDLQQIGFLGGDTVNEPIRVAVRAANLAGMGGVFGSAGAGILVLSGAVSDQVELDAYAAALPGTELSVVRLRADEQTLRSRLCDRVVGSPTLNLPGDDLRGLSPDAQEAVLRRALSQAARLDASAVGHPIETSGRSVAEIVDDIFEAIDRQRSGRREHRGGRSGAS